MKKIYVLVSIAVAMLAYSPAIGSHVLGSHVVLAGDSITADSGVGYADDFESIFSGMTTVVGAGGLDASSFATTYAQLAVDANPDVIVFMLGINSALRPTDVEGNYDEHRKRIATGSDPVIFNKFDSLPSNVEVIVLSILPVDISASGIDNLTNTRVNGTGVTSEEDVSFGYNPFYEAEVQRRNADTTAGPTYRYVDLLDPSQANTVFANSFLMTDGLHLNTTGQAWLANEVLFQVTGVPEPSAFMTLGMIALSLAIARRRSIDS